MHPQTSFQHLLMMMQGIRKEETALQMALGWTCEAIPKPTQAGTHITFHPLYRSNIV